MSRSARHTAGLRRGVTQARSAVRATYGPSQPPEPVCRQYSAAQGLLRVQGCDAFAQRSPLLGAYIPVSVHVPPEVQEDGGATSSRLGGGLSRCAMTGSPVSSAT